MSDSSKEVKESGRNATVELEQASASSLQRNDLDNAPQQPQQSNIFMMSRALWLIRVPPDVASAWENIPDNREVAQVKITNDGSGGGPQVLLSLNGSPSSSASSISSQEKVGKSQPVFHKYRLTEFGDPQITNIFAVNDSNEDKEPSVAGRIRKKFKGFPIRDESYKKHLAAKDLHMKQHRQPIKLEKAVNCYKPVADHKNNIEYAKKKKQEGRKCRGDIDQVAQTLFAAFETHQYYSFKDLVKITNQPPSFLKEVLKEYGNFCTQGANRSLWELKPEYRHYS